MGVSGSSKGTSEVLRPAEVLGRTEHRPYPVPKGTWAIGMSWRDLLFMHWPLDAEALRPLVPPALSLDTFDGSAWLGIVPFRMTGVRPRFLPAFKPLSDFPEINLRTYVTAGGKPGIWFFSLDAHNPVAVRLARATFRLPYFDARMSCETSGGEVRYSSERIHGGVPPAELAARYRPSGAPFECGTGTLENFLSERYCLYAADGRGIVRRGDVHHYLWPLHSSERLDVLAWPPRRLSS